MRRPPPARRRPRRSRRPAELQSAKQSLAQAERAWGRTTTLTRPSHEFVTVSRELYETLTIVGKAARHPSVHPERAAAHLDRGIAAVGDLMAATRTMPDRLLTANILRAPATTIRSTDDRLRARSRGRYVQVRPLDVARPAHQLAERRDRPYATALRRPCIRANHLVAVDRPGLAEAPRASGDPREQVRPAQTRRTEAGQEDYFADGGSRARPTPTSGGLAMDAICLLGPVADPRHGA